MGLRPAKHLRKRIEMDKKDNLKILQELKQSERSRLISILPMSIELLKDFFDYLDKNLDKNENGKALSLTEEFCNQRNIDFEKVKEWAAELGGYDDAEILWNVEEVYEFLSNDDL